MMKFFSRTSQTSQFDLNLNIIYLCRVGRTKNQTFLAEFLVYPIKIEKQMVN